MSYVTNAFHFPRNLYYIGGEVQLDAGLLVMTNKYNKKTDRIVSVRRPGKSEVSASSSEIKSAQERLMLMRLHNFCQVKCMKRKRILTPNPVRKTWTFQILRGIGQGQTVRPSKEDQAWINADLETPLKFVQQADLV